MGEEEVCRPHGDVDRLSDRQVKMSRCMYCTWTVLYWAPQSGLDVWHVSMNPESFIFFFNLDGKAE